jgi:hypothetical protein
LHTYIAQTNNNNPSTPRTITKIDDRRGASIIREFPTIRKHSADHRPDGFPVLGSPEEVLPLSAQLAHCREARLVGAHQAVQPALREAVGRQRHEHGAPPGPAAVRGQRGLVGAHVLHRGGATGQGVQELGHLQTVTGKQRERGRETNKLWVYQLC